MTATAHLGNAKVTIASLLRPFIRYVDSLDWGPGQRDKSAFNAFLRAGSLGIPSETAVDAVTSRILATGGTFDPSKIQSQLRRAYEFAGAETGASKALVKPPKPGFCADKLKKIAAQVSGICVEWLAQRSTVPPADVTSQIFLEQLYRVGENVLVFTNFHSQGQCLYGVGMPWSPPLPTASPEGVWYLVNPVDGESRPNPRMENKLSRRSEESVTSWRYLVLESDIADPQDWLSCLVQLPVRIAAIYTSGGKSIHALVRLDATSKADWDRQRDEIKPIVVTLGADEAALTAVRLSRLPGTLRAEKPQRLLYLNPEPTGTPIHVS